MEQQEGSTSKEMIWASRWSVALRTFYRQILSLLYSSFPFGNLRPRLVRALLVVCSTVMPVLNHHPPPLEESQGTHDFGSPRGDP